MVNLLASLFPEFFVCSLNRYNPSGGLGSKTLIGLQFF
jgi:hypothetical protein